jgi:hypothetical protein
MKLPISLKKAIGIFKKINKNCAESVSCFDEYCHLNNKKSSSP